MEKKSLQHLGVAVCRYGQDEHGRSISSFLYKRARCYKSGRTRALERIVFSGPFILSFLLTPVWGVLGDRFGKKKMVLRAIFGLAVSQFLIGLSANVWQLFAFRMVQGAISGFIASSLALVSASTPKERSGYSIGILQTSISSGTVIGPFIGGFIADMTSYRTVFFITSAICFFSGLLVIINVRARIRRFKKIIQRLSEL
ncbi:MAG: MFS transporter [Ignavibacteria bacterium]|nr:MFS transporter [Ignavibacteria bacterium]